MNPAFTILKKVFTSRITWVLIAILVVVILIRANWDNLTGWTQRTYGNFGEPAITPTRKSELEDMARNTYAEIDGLTTSADFLDPLAALNDLELRYVAQFYADAITRGTKLSDDIDAEWIMGDDDEKLVARLRQMNL